jgi:hypothetical protein
MAHVRLCGVGSATPCAPSDAQGRDSQESQLLVKYMVPLAVRGGASSGGASAGGSGTGSGVGGVRGAAASAARAAAGLVGHVGRYLVVGLFGGR